MHTPLQDTGVHQIDQVQLFSKLSSHSLQRTGERSRFIVNMTGYSRAGLQSRSNNNAAFESPNLLPLESSRNITAGKEAWDNPNMGLLLVVQAR